MQTKGSPSKDRLKKRGGGRESGEKIKKRKKKKNQNRPISEVRCRETNNQRLNPGKLLKRPKQTKLKQ